MADEIWIDSPLADTQFPLDPGQQTHRLEVMGRYQILRFQEDKKPLEDKASTLAVVVTKDGTSYPPTTAPGNPTGPMGSWKAVFQLPLGDDYSVTATLTTNNGTTSDTHENIDVVSTSPIVIPPPGGGYATDAAPRAPMVLPVKINVSDPSRKGTWVLCTLRRWWNPKPKPKPDKADAPNEEKARHQHQQYRIIGAQAVRVTGPQLCATFTLTKPFKKPGQIIAHAVLLNDAGEPVGQASQVVGELPTEK